MNIAVIGSGFGGIAAAIRLQSAGHQVTIFEKQDRPGGRATVFQQDGFTFDAGPTIVTAPQLFDELFALAGRSRADVVDLVKLDPFYNIRFEDGSVFAYSDNRKRLLAQIRRFDPADVAGYRRFYRHAEAVFNTGFPLISTPFLTLSSMFRVAPDLVRLQAFRSVAGIANRYLRDSRLRQVFSFHPLLIGGNPFTASAIYALIHPLEQHWGVWFPLGGVGALVAALIGVFRDLGGRIELNAPVSQILVDPHSRRAIGIEVNGRREPADVVVSNADVATTYLSLIDPVYRRHNTDGRIRRLRQSMSLVVIYFGTNRRYPATAHHEILMGPRYQGLLSDIFGRKHLPDDFSLYLHRPTATDPSLAPPGCDAFYVLSPVPNLAGAVDWERDAVRYRDTILDYLEARYLPNLRQHIVTMKMVDPRYFRDALGSYLGSGFSVEPVLWQSAWFRPHNRSEDIPNLYLVGAGTHPGAGLPGVISSGKIAAELIGGRPPTPIPRSRSVGLRSC